MKYYLIAGEASGDLHAANLMKAIKEKDPEANFRYFGGDEMLKQGGTLVKHYRDMAYMGFMEVIKHLPTILSLMKQCKADIKSFSPDVVILVDYPSFNLKVAKYVKLQLGLPVHYYIAPKLWAWKEYRIKELKAYVDKVWSILPFEPDYFAKFNYKVEYVGNPTVDELVRKKEAGIDCEAFKSSNSLSQKPIIALLAGSRRAEVRDNLNIMLEAIKDFDQYQAVIAGAPGLDREYYDEVIGDYKNVSIVFGQTHELLLASNLATVTSGTATLEAAVMGVPQVVCYRLGGGKFFYKLMEKVLKIKYVSLVNLIVDKEVVKELLGYKLTSDSLKIELQKIILDPIEYDKIEKGYGEMMTRLGGIGAADKAASCIVDTLQKKA